MQAHFDFRSHISQLVMILDQVLVVFGSNPTGILHAYYVLNVLRFTSFDHPYLVVFVACIY